MPMAASALRLLSPNYMLRLNGKNMAQAEKPFVMSILHQDHVNGLHMVELTLNIYDAAKNKFKILDEGQFELGHEVAVSLGFGSDLKEMMSGEVTALTPNFNTGTARTMRVLVYDKGHRLTQGKKVRNFLGLKDSEIVQKIAREAGLKAEVQDTATVIPQVIQNNLSDMEFIRQRARRYDFEAFTMGDTFNFVRSRETTGPVLKFDFGVHFTEFHPRMSLSEPVSEVELRGWDSNNKQEIRGRARKGSEHARMKGDLTASSLAEKVFGEQKVVVTNVNVYNASQADRFAQAILDGQSRQLIQGKLQITGNNKLKAGMVIELGGLTKSFNGLYYIESSTHTFDSRGYNTVLDLRRNGK